MTTIQIKGMSCQHCVSSVAKALEALPGISDVQVDLDNGEARFQGEADEQTVKQTIDNIGFEVI